MGDGQNKMIIRLHVSCLALPVLGFHLLFVQDWQVDISLEFPSTVIHLNTYRSSRVDFLAVLRKKQTEAFF